MKRIDITGDIGPLYRDERERKCPMYSFARPAHLFWNGFANGLMERGFTEAQIFDELQSKGPRWLLDMDGGKLEALGKRLAKDYDPVCCKAPAKEKASTE